MLTQSHHPCERQTPCPTSVPREALKWGAPRGAVVGCTYRVWELMPRHRRLNSFLGARAGQGTWGWDRALAEGRSLKLSLYPAPGGRVEGPPAFRRVCACAGGIRARCCAPGTARPAAGPSVCVRPAGDPGIDWRVAASHCPFGAAGMRDVWPQACAGACGRAAEAAGPPHTRRWMPVATGAS